MEAGGRHGRVMYQARGDKKLAALLHSAARRLPVLDAGWGS